MKPQFITPARAAGRFSCIYPLGQQPVSLGAPKFPLLPVVSHFRKHTMLATDWRVKEKLIFIVDDDVDDKDLFIEALKELDDKIKCHTAWNGEDALEKLSLMDELPAYIFVDINMPKVNGKQFLGELMTLERFNKIPVIMLTTSHLEEDIDETRNLGATFFLTKPNSFAELKNFIDCILNNKDCIKPNHGLVRLKQA